MHPVNKRNPFLLLLCLFGSLFSLPSCTKFLESPVVRQSTAMNTYITVTIYDHISDADVVNGWIDSVFAEIRRIEGMATDYNDTSEVGRINAGAGVDSVAVSDELISLLRESLRYGRLSGHAFDIGIEPVVKLWDFLSPNPHCPAKDKIMALLPLINPELMSIVGDKVYLHRKGMGIDLGGIAKGYAVDRSAQLLVRGGFKRFIVDIGGNLSVHWDGTSMLDSTVAEILIRHPRKEGEFFGKFMMGTGGVSTSGDYQRFFMENGFRYHHIIDPFTGYPARGVVSVTIVAPEASSADAISTLVFVLGREKGMDFIRNTTGVEGMIVFESGDTLGYDLSPGFQRRFFRDAQHD
jgi:thiamine biosynthesis lipoprotein